MNRQPRAPVVIPMEVLIPYKSLEVLIPYKTEFSLNEATNLLKALSQGITAILWLKVTSFLWYFTLSHLTQTEGSVISYSGWWPKLGVC